MIKWFFIKFYNLNYKIKKAVSAGYYKFRNKWMMRSVNVEFDKSLLINGKIQVTNMGKISIGKNVVINSGTVPNPVGTAITRLYSHNKNSEIIIEDNVGISSSLIYAVEKVTVGKDTMIGGDCLIVDTDFHSININPETGKRGAGKSAPITIGENVFIGARSIILKGVTIGDGSVIGAGSIVTKDVPAGEIWAGNPAVFVRKTE